MRYPQGTTNGWHGVHTRLRRDAPLVLQDLNNLRDAADARSCQNSPALCPMEPMFQYSLSESTILCTHAKHSPTRSCIESRVRGCASALLCGTASFQSSNVTVHHDRRGERLSLQLRDSPPVQYARAWSATSLETHSHCVWQKENSRWHAEQGDFMSTAGCHWSKRSKRSGTPVCWQRA